MKRLPAGFNWAAVIGLSAALSLVLALQARHGDHSPLRYLMAVIVVAVPFLLIRRRPLAALAVTLGSTFVMTMLVEPANLTELRYAQFLVQDVAVAVIAATHRSRTASIATAMVVGVQVFVSTIAPTSEDATTAAILIGLTVFAAALVGNSIRLRRINADALRTRVAAEAATAERLRIAREVHDMVAHSIAVIAIQAGVGRRVMRTQPAEASRALETIEATSRETLAGLRRTLGALREGASPLEPLPGLADLDRLASSTLHAGVRMDVRWNGSRRPVADDIDLSAYRIIQEAVSNVVRHAGTTECLVTVDYRDSELGVEIADDGRGCADAPAGFGIVGMRERAELLHGTFSAGPRPEGGFRVTAVLPAPASVEVAA